MSAWTQVYEPAVERGMDRSQHFLVAGGRAGRPHRGLGSSDRAAGHVGFHGKKELMKLNVCPSPIDLLHSADLSKGRPMLCGASGGGF